MVIVDVVFFLQNWHEHISIKDVVLPKLVKLLSSEGHTLASVYPRVLPLLHKMPLDLVEEYLEAILDAIKMGVKTFILTSSTARQHHGSCQTGGLACVTAFFEVSLYALKNTHQIQVKSGVYNQVSCVSKASVHAHLQLHFLT